MPLPDAPGRVTPSPTPEEVTFIVDEEAMGDAADRYQQVTPTPTPEATPEPVYDDWEDDEGFPEDF